MANLNSNKQQKGQLFIIVFAIILLILAVVYFIWGVTSIWRIIVYGLEIMLLVSTVFAIAYLFYWLFIKKHKFDVVYYNKQKLIEACQLLKRPILKDLYISGDKKHTRAKVGAITGYARIQVLTRNYIYDNELDEKGNPIKVQRTQLNERGEKIPVYELESMEQDVFTVKKAGLGGLFSDPLVIRLSPTDHDELVGDVTLFGFSLIPISEFWFLNTDHLDIRKIDYSVLRECERHVNFVVLSDMKELIDRATGMDGHHKKDIQQKSLVEIPEFKNTGQQTQL